MDVSADLALQAILDFFSKGRTSDFVNGIDNEALDFSQLEDFINNENTQSNNNYFNESLNPTTTITTTSSTTITTSSTTTATPTTGKLLNVIIENNKRNTGHSLPESPPDSSSEHPYSPQDGCDPTTTTTSTTTPTTDANIYTTLGPTIYKPTLQQTNLINPILGDNLILGSHIVVNDTNTDFAQQQQQQEQQNDNLLLTDNNRNLYKNDDLVPQHHHHHQQHHHHHLNYHHGLDVAVPTTLQRGGGSGGGNDLDLPVVYTNLQSVPKKRKLSQDSPLVKSEPEHCTTSQLSPTGPLSTSIEDEYTTTSSDACLSETQYQCIRFSPFQQTQWHSLCDQNLTELPVPHYRVDADKGFNFSNADDAFVCQKKNHFQITCHVQLLGDAQFVKTPDGLQKISSFHLHFYGVKHDCPTQTIRVEQSQSDRSKKPFHPVLIELVNSQVTKVTVGRLHFSETTSNNMRKKGKPNPEQRYFQLVVGLHAHTINGNFPVISHASQKIIVRASNPGQFESDVELCWQKGQVQDSVYHNGKVGINTDRPDESLVIHGNIKLTGHIIQPSDIRAKKNIVECDPREQLRNVQKLRVVKYDYEPIIASQLNQNTQCSDTGVIAQEVAEILPEAVQPAGDLLLHNGESIDNFLVVNKERIFMENIGAVKELCRVTDNLETRIDQLERINRRLNKLKRGDSLKSNSTVNSSKNSYSAKCSKHHKCNKDDEDDELCSNKFIQIIIVVLVLIMAFCLAAITTLYLLETARHNHFIQSNLQVTQQHNDQQQHEHEQRQQQQQQQQQYHRTIITKRPVKNTKNIQQQWQQIIEQQQQQQQQQRIMNTYRDDEEITRITVDTNLIKRPSFIIGRPSDCLTVDQDLENTNLCQIYCCAPITPTSTIIPPPPPEFVDKNPPSSTTLTTIATIINNDHQNNNNSDNKTQLLSSSTDDKVNKISRTFHSNDIDKQRQKRDAFDLNDEANSFDSSDDQLFAITLQGRHFNTTLTRKYLISDLSPYNFTYSIPVSKYMPDEFINLIFRSTQANIKEVEHCYNGYKQHECLFINPLHFYDDKQQQQQIRHKVNENNPSQLLKSQSIIFEVDMADFQTKIMTYRAALRQNQNICKSPITRVGIDFIEYNFHFYRRCDE